MDNTNLFSILIRPGRDNTASDALFIFLLLLRLFSFDSLYFLHLVITLSMHAYFIRLKPVTNKKETPRGISSERFHEVLVNVLKEILSQDSGNEEYVRSFMENREAIINLMITNCIECKTKDEKQETDEGDDVTQENIFKLSFDKSTGRKRTRSEAS